MSVVIICRCVTMFICIRWMCQSQIVHWSRLVSPMSFFFRGRHECVSPVPINHELSYLILGFLGVHLYNDTWYLYRYIRSRTLSHIFLHTPVCHMYSITIHLKLIMPMHPIGARGPRHTKVHRERAVRCTRLWRMYIDMDFQNKHSE